MLEVNFVEPSCFVLLLKEAIIGEIMVPGCLSSNTNNGATNKNKTRIATKNCLFNILILKNIMLAMVASATVAREGSAWKAKPAATAIRIE